MQTLQELEQRIPIASDKALINLVNGIQINRDLICYRKSRGFFGKLFDGSSGADRERQILLDGNLIAGQQALCDWVLELTDSLRISQIALEITQNSLLEARSAIRRQKGELSAQKQDLSMLDSKLDQLTQKVDDQLCTFECRLRKLELRVAAKEEFDLILADWKAGQTYRDLPWIVQISLLIKEVFGSAVIRYELEEIGDPSRYRDLLVHEILARSERTYAKFFSLSDLLDLTWQQFRSVEDLELSLGILEIRSLPPSRVQQMPLWFTMATTLELAVLSEEVRPVSLASCAVELCRTQVRSLDYTTDLKEFVTQLIHEVAEDHLSTLFATTKKLEEIVR